MKLIAEYDERKKAVLEQYNIRVESLGKGFATIETDDRYLKWILHTAKNIEADASIQLNRKFDKSELRLE